MLGNNFTLHDVLRLYSEQYWQSLADNWCSVNTAKSVEFCLPIVQGGGSSKSGKSLKGVSKKSIFASPESIQRLVVVSLKTVAVLYEVFGISTVKHDGTTK